MASPSPESNQPPPPPPVPLATTTTDCSQGFCSPYCPQWCYVLFPPPPPFPFDPETADGSSAGPTFSPLVIAIIGILSCAFLLIAYYTILPKFCGASFARGCRRRRRRGAPPGPGGSESDNEDPARRSSRRRDQERHLPPPSTVVGLDEAMISRIAVCKYEKGDGLVGCTDCSVCLGEFREGESLRLLPECGHAFHVQCIDAWLKSHSNCPLCRAGIVAPPSAPPASEASDEPVVVVLVGESTDHRGTAGLEGGTGDRRLDRGNLPRPAANERFILVGLLSSCFRCR